MKKLYVFIAILFISGCSTKFAYRNIDWLAYWYLDDFIEFTDEQQDVFDLRLDKWLAWHKQNELPKYIAQLNQLSDEIINQQISMERIDYHQDKAREHWLRLRAYITPDLVEMAPMLAPDQVTYLFAALEKENTKREKELQERAEKSDSKKANDRLKRTLKQTKRWLGKLNSEQESLIENTLPQFYSNGSLWLEYRRNYQNQLRALFVQTSRDEAFSATLTELLLNPEQFRTAELEERNQANADIYANMLLSLSALSTEKQRQRASDEILEFADDFTDLMD